MSDLPWLKLYTEAFHDPKFIVAATDNQMDEMTVFGIWTALLCMAARSPVRGKLVASNNRNFTIEQLDAVIGWHGNMGTGDLSSLMNSFMDLDMVVVDEQGAYCIANFEERQETKEEREKRLNRERQKRYRESHITEDSVTNNAPITQDSLSISTSISISNSISDSLTESYTKYIGEIKPAIILTLQQADKDYPADWFPKAFEIMAGNGRKSWSYAEGILKNWKTTGIPTGKKIREPARGDHGATPEAREKYNVEVDNESYALDESDLAWVREHGG